MTLGGWAVDVTARAAAAVARATTARATTLLTKGWRDTTTRTRHGHYDLTITDHYAPLIQTALGRLYTAGDLRAATITARQVAPTVKAATSDPHWPVISSVAQAHLRTLGADTARLLTLLRQVRAAGWVAGTHVALGQTGSTATGPLATVLTSIDWSTWQPGDIYAALKVADGAFAALLDSAGLTLRGLLDTTVRQIGDAIAAGLLDGASVDTIAASLTGLLAGNDWRALVIAHTETARAMTAATFDVYAANGIRQWDWLTTSGACPACLDAEARNPHDLGEAGPPLHPMCRCAAAPALNPTQPVGDVGGSQVIDLTDSGAVEPADLAAP